MASGFWLPKRRQRSSEEEPNTHNKSISWSVPFPPRARSPCELCGGNFPAKKRRIGAATIVCRVPCHCQTGRREVGRRHVRLGHACGVPVRPSPVRTQAAQVDSQAWRWSQPSTEAMAIEEVSCTRARGARNAGIPPPMQRHGNTRKRLQGACIETASRQAGVVDKQAAKPSYTGCVVLLLVKQRKKE